MTPVVAIGNAAGSAGKTTTAVSLAALAGADRRVLVVDADAQATATQWLGAGPRAVSLGDVLLKQAEPRAAVIETSTPGVWLLPAASRLDGQVKEWERQIGAEQRLRRILDDVAADFDLVLIDLPGQISTMTVAGLVASDKALAVTRPTLKEINGVARFLTAVDEIRDAFARDTPATAGVIVCEVPPPNAGGLYAAAVQLAQETWPDLVGPTVRRSVRVPDSFAAGRPLPAVFPAAPVTADHRLVLDWLTARGIL
ncbi:MAG: ParA family protein [Propionibacteriaceae bacterium]|jgi:chromosome partitioning protein|nr:ParA family protein [Propionibacteriaceae bacterium]